MELRCFSHTSLRWIKDGEITKLRTGDNYPPIAFDWVRWTNFECNVVAPKSMVLWE